MVKSCLKPRSAWLKTRFSAALGLRMFCGLGFKSDSKLCGALQTCLTLKAYISLSNILSKTNTLSIPHSRGRISD